MKRSIRARCVAAWVSPVGELVTPEQALGGDIALVAPVEDWFDAKAIARVDVFAPDHAAPGFVPLPNWPRPGEYYASPALAALIDATPPEMLGNRYGTRVGIIGADHLKGPDSLVVVVGQSPEVLAHRRHLVAAETAKGKPDTDSNSFRSIAAIGAVGMLFPVLLFVAIATKLGAASRRESFSVLRLIGATPRQIGMIAGIETLLVSCVGTALGAGLAVLFRPLAARFEAVGASFYPADLDIGTGATLTIAAAIVLSATLVAAIGMWRADIGPLGASRAIAEKPARWWRILPLLVGFGLLFLGASDLLDENLAEWMGVTLFLCGFVFIMIGLVVIGPWLTAHVGRLTARLTGSAAGVIVANRIAQAPVAIFRSVSGLVIAVFLVTLFSAASSGVVSRFLTTETPNRLPLDALLVGLADGSDSPTELVGADRLVTGYTAPGIGNDIIVSGADFGALGIVATGEADSYYRIDLVLYLAGVDHDQFAIAKVPFSRADLTPEVLIARTDGTLRALETARTALERQTLWFRAPMTRIERNLAGPNRLLKELSLIAYSGALITILISGLSLTVSTLGALIDRRRTFGLMRLIGMPDKTLDRVVFLEAAIPLAGVLAFSIAAGYFAAYLIVRTLTEDLSIGAPDLTYFLFLAAGLFGALAILQLSKHLARHMISDEVVRFE